MRIECKCGGEEFEVYVPATVSAFVSASGEIYPGLVATVHKIEKYDPALKIYVCTSCGGEATVHP